MADRLTVAERPLHFLRSQALHARTKDKKIDFANLIGLYVGDIQSRSMSELNLAFELTFSARNVSVNENNYVLAFRCGVLQIDIDNGAISPGSIYGHVLQAGDIKATSKNEDAQHASRKLGADVGGEVGAGHTGWVSRITASLRLGGNREVEKNSTENEIIAERILLVYGGGHNCVQVGCPSRGDPRHPSGWLLGPVISVADKGRATPLCIIEAEDPKKPVSVHLSFRFNPQQPCLFKGPKDSKGELLDHNLDKINAQMLKRRIKSNESLKEHIATLGAFRDFLREPGLGVAGGDLMLASISGAYIPSGG